MRFEPVDENQMFVHYDDGGISTLDRDPASGLWTAELIAAELRELADKLDALNSEEPLVSLSLDVAKDTMELLYILLRGEKAEPDEWYPEVNLAHLRAAIATYVAWVEEK